MRDTSRSSVTRGEPKLLTEEIRLLCNVRHRIIRPMEGVSATKAAKPCKTGSTAPESVREIVWRSCVRLGLSNACDTRVHDRRAGLLSRKWDRISTSTSADKL